MTAFYQALLGVAPAQQTEGWVEFRSGSSTLMLHSIPDPVAAEIVLSTPPEPREQTPIKLIFTVENLAAERVRWAAAGIGLVERPWGSCDGMDPEGNIFSIMARAED